MPQLDIYQYLRGFQMIAALFGMGLSGTNLRDAYLDQKWLKNSGSNGVRAITASSLIVHETGHLLLQFVLMLIGLMGLMFDGHAGNFDNLETMLDTIVVIIVLLVSWHSHYVRITIRGWTSHLQRRSSDRILPNPHTQRRFDDIPSGADRNPHDPKLRRRHDDLPVRKP
jgi:hypothetical protein